MCVVNTNINRNMEKYCQNCGHLCHCNKICWQKYDEGGDTLCCKYCRHDKEEKKQTSNEDLFNGA